MKKRSRTYKGLPVSPGIAIGRVHLLESAELHLPKYWISEREVANEIAKFRLALKKTQQQLRGIRERLCKYQSGEQIGIIDSHRMIATDEMLVTSTLEQIRKEKINAEWAFEKALQELRGSFPDSTDPFFRERRADLKFVAQRIFENMTGPRAPAQRHFKKNSIVVAHDLSPADTIQMGKGIVQGFITEVGGWTSHTAIVARALEIPAVAGVDGLTSLVEENCPVLIDGTEGQVLLRPTQKELRKHLAMRRRYEHLEDLLLKEARLPSVTQDGVRLQLAANMEIVDEIPTIKKFGAEGIGLYRTEILYLQHKRIPTEEEQFEVYRKVLRRMRPHPVTIRTFDIGGEKDLTSPEDFETVNPAMGLRAIRYCLKEKDLFRTQLRALLRASRFGRLKILIPMVSNLEEVRQVKKILSEVQEGLQAERIRFDPGVKLGIMIEVPSAALMADALSAEVDFLSIGTNDLIQYTLAIDRASDEVAYLYEPLHPAILRLLKQVLEGARKRNVDVTLCGEMASDPLCFLLLVGLGLNELSMNPISIPRVKRLLRSVTFRQTAELVDRALTCRTATEVEHAVRREAAKIPDFPQV